MPEAGVVFALPRYRTFSRWRRARISTWSEARVRSAELSPASRDISTSRMAQDATGTSPKGNDSNRYEVFGRDRLLKGNRNIGPRDVTSSRISVPQLEPADLDIRGDSRRSSLENERSQPPEPLRERS